MVGFDFAFSLVLVVEGVRGFTFSAKGKRVAVDSLDEIVLSRGGIAGLIKDATVGKFIVLQGKIIGGCVVVGIFDRDMLDDGHGLFLLSVLAGECLDSIADFVEGNDGLENFGL